MYRLYYSAGACSLAVHVLLNELNVPFELINAPTSGPKDPEFLKLNPRGSVPVLLDDGKVIREGGAILTYLCDKHKSELLPQSGYERAQALEWLMFCNATLHPAYGRFFFLSKNPVEASAQDTLYQTWGKGLQKLWDEVEQVLGQHAYLAGDKITVGDILLTVIANWSPKIKVPPTLGSNTKRLLQAVSSRPAFQKALATENVEYKAAA